MAGYPGNERHSQYRRSSDYTSLGDALGGQPVYPPHSQSQSQSQPSRGHTSGQQPPQYPAYSVQQPQPAHHQNYHQPQNWSTDHWGHPQQQSGYPNPSQHHQQGLAGPSPGPSNARPSSPHVARRPTANARHGSVISRTASPRSSAASPPPNNFSQIAGTYQSIMHAIPGDRPPDSAVLQRMLAAATQGQRQLAGMTPPPPPPPHRASSIPSPAPISAHTPAPSQHMPQPASPSSSSNTSGSNPGHFVQQQADTGQACLGCGATQTPEWRRGPLGPRTLCNACGLVYAKMLKKRQNEPAGSTSLYGINDEDEDGNSPSYAPR
ncbi:unnamed protein product [Peniophora sp. CBMAI 1063]|nr:unnamed protein product [Peniophora sp. CBMAI 1063]